MIGNEPKECWDQLSIQETNNTKIYIFDSDLVCQMQLIPTYFRLKKKLCVEGVFNLKCVLIEYKI